MADYQQWLTEFNRWLKDVKQNELEPALKRFIEAQGTVKSLSKDKLDEYKHYLLRDLAHFNSYKIDETNELAWQELKAHLLYEISQVEDRTQLEWQALMSDFSHKGTYKQGEWIALGQLVCKNCKSATDIFYVTEISACRECGHTEFIRKTLTP